MDIPLLRILAQKSSLGFGKYSDMTIQDIIDLQKHSYLRWIYFNIEGISFNNEILDKIHIFDNYRILKPGININKFKELSAHFHDPISYHDPIKYFKMKARSNKVQVGNYIANKNRYNIYSKKSVLQAKNQGH